MACELFSVFYKIRRSDKQILQYKDKYKGKRCFIIATGPSLTLSDLELLKSEITFSMNSIVNIFDKTSFRPTFYVLQDGNVEKRLRGKINSKDFVKGFIGLGNLFGFKINISKSIQKKFYNECIPYNLDVAYHYYDMCYSDQNYIKTKFSDDCFAGVSDGCTVTYSVIQLAAYMGFKEIYLLGCDTNYSGHIDDNYKSINSDPVYRMIGGYQAAQKFAQGSTFKVYNATRGGMLEVFERVTLESVLKDE